jgi:transporter family-2 protein
VLVGIGSATQSRVNGSLGTALGSGFHAATISFAVGLVLLVAIALAFGRVRRGLRSVLEALAEGRLPWWGLIGGALGSTFVLSQGLAVPTLGVAVFMTSMVLGQLVGSLLVDAAGLFGAPKRPISLMRVAGALLTALAVALIGWGGNIGPEALPFMALAVGSGAAISVQMAVTGLVNAHAGEPVSPGLINFVVGTLILGAVALIAESSGWVEVAPLPGLDEWWLYLGGILGVLYLLLVAAVVHIIGVFLLTLSVVAGQLIGSLVFDVAAGHASVLLFVGVPLAFCGIVTANLGARRRIR